MLDRYDANVVEFARLAASVEAGLGIGFVSRWAVEQRLPLGRFRIMTVAGLEIPRNFCLVYPSGPGPCGTPGAFRRFVLEYCGAISVDDDAPAKSAGK